MVIETSGARKTAVARATIKEGKGRIRINGVPIEIYQPELAKLKMMEPIILAGDKVSKIDIAVNMRGGGVIGQAEAARTAISRAMVDFFKDQDLEKTYKEYDRALLVNDVRKKLPKKPGGSGARKKKQKSYR
ncbi:MAG: 30S ribosomal protein S9 [Thermoplasmatales archaeon]|jgi:small subunit ribosomal protein S9|nr:30S ribosomal protein S9 [Candidatus Thermoplasmatota archaeon]MCL6002599.1 30S ribosomal protein S9 [Candidatus Thermoplasmatota archaeon]MDA8054582.1 30S ribosomal protein S9 [Thermoplasmatales archaeon]